jgi:hypothetical protein
MDFTTAAALRAIVSGLRRSGAISDPHVTAVVSELEALDAGFLKTVSPDRIAVRRLCMGIADDGGVETTIQTEEPAMEWPF